MLSIRQNSLYLKVDRIPRPFPGVVSEVEFVYEGESSADWTVDNNKESEYQPWTPLIHNDFITRTRKKHSTTFDCAHMVYSHVWFTPCLCWECYKPALQPLCQRITWHAEAGGGGGTGMFHTCPTFSLFEVYDIQKPGHQCMNPGLCALVFSHLTSCACVHDNEETHRIGPSWVRSHVL